MKSKRTDLLELFSQNGPILLLQLEISRNLPELIVFVLDDGETLKKRTGKEDFSSTSSRRVQKKETHTFSVSTFNLSSPR